MPSHNPYTFDRVVRMVIGALIIFGILWLIDLLKIGRAHV